MDSFAEEGHLLANCLLFREVGEPTDFSNLKDNRLGG